MGTPKYRLNTDYFTYHNQNPKNKKRSADCVARAISFGLRVSWEWTVKEITSYGISRGLVFNEKNAYGGWLEENGYMMYKQPRKPDNTKYTVKEFAILHPKGIYIIGIANHLTVIEDGIIYDTWNCSNKTVGNYWHFAGF